MMRELEKAGYKVLSAGDSYSFYFSNFFDRLKYCILEQFDRKIISSQHDTENSDSTDSSQAERSAQNGND
jgi:hypothetical protein